MLRRSVIVLIVSASLLGGCCRPHASAAPADAVVMVRTELFFGLSRPDGGVVSDQQWRDFLSTTVTPLFPKGLTVLEASGQWQEESGRIAREPSRVLVLLHLPTAEDNEKIERVRAAYKAQFVQEAVMRTDSPARVVF
ncbi:MAG: DUF3574 domain-containing protein [Phycisphaerales bacterium]